MSTTYQPKSERRVMEVESGGAAVEAIGGLGVIVLSILGLIGLVPAYLGPIAGIVFGVSILTQGTAIAAEVSSLFAKVAGTTFRGAELGGGMTAEIMAGGTAIVLGVLALLQIATDVLLPSLVIAGGAAVMLTAGSIRRLNDLKVEAAESGDAAQRVMHAATSGAAASQILAGVAAVVLGIIALASTPTAATAGGATWMTLSLVGLLVLGASTMMGGGSLTGRLVQMINRSAAG